MTEDPVQLSQGLRPANLRDEPWLACTETQSVLEAIARGGFEARAVGGAVRNALMGVPVKDVDIATTATPEDIIRLAESAGLRAVPTGLAHGTVTVIADRRPFEVTTLRRDVETFGRHARVAFTDDWAEDAARRDFTMNALYCDRDGVVHDPLGGYSDLVQRRVRFIGTAEDRIREDYLRILRFFRFSAAYGRGAPDADGVAACVALADGLSLLSGERIRSELLRLMATPRAPEIVAVMSEAGLIETLLGGSVTVPLLARISAIETALERDGDALLRLAALASGRPASDIAQRLKLSNAEAERIGRLAFPSDPAFRPDRDEREARVYLYRFGVEPFRDGVLMAWARSGASAEDASWRARLGLPERWTAPALPVRGADIIDKGLAEGPAVGRVVRAFEEWWIAEDFPSDTLRLAKVLSDLVKANRN